jgi:hypothetical protein
MNAMRKILARIRWEYLLSTRRKPVTALRPLDVDHYCYLSGVPDLLAYGTGCSCAFADPKP